MNPDIPKTGVVVAGHGSRDSEGVAEFEAMVRLLQERVAPMPVAHGFLEFSKPTIDEAIRSVAARGVTEISVVPGILFAAAHGKNDIPAEVQVMRRELPGVQIKFGAPLHLHPSLLAQCRERIVEAEGRAGGSVPRDECCLVVVGRGTTDPAANSDVSKLARILEEGMGFGGSFVCYSGTAEPSVVDGLELAAKLGFARYLVLPYFLFTGVLVKRIVESTESVAAKYPQLQFVSCGHLGPCDAVAAALAERAQEAQQGQVASDCSLCKYRVSVVGYEEQVGQPQAPHHLHVRAAAMAPVPNLPKEADTHPIEDRSFEIIAAGRDWSGFDPDHVDILQRLVHTSGDYTAPDTVYISKGAPDSGLRALREGAVIVADVTMVVSGMRRRLLDEFGLKTFCGVHDPESLLMSKAHNMTRSASGIRRAWEKFGNDCIVAIGDAPTAVEEAIRIIKEHRWRPHLVIGLPVGFVGTPESKEHLRSCLNIPRITNSGTRGGSPWAAAVVNSLLLRLAAERRRSAGGV